MIRKNLQVTNKLGLHARAAAKVVSVASRHDSRISICHNNQTVDAKNIMGMLILGATKGTVLEFEIDGPDEQLALDELEHLFADFFGEGE